MLEDESLRQNETKNTKQKKECTDNTREKKNWRERNIVVNSLTWTPTNQFNQYWTFHQIKIKFQFLCNIIF